MHAFCILDYCKRQRFMVTRKVRFTHQLWIAVFAGNLPTCAPCNESADAVHLVCEKFQHGKFPSVKLPPGDSPPPPHPRGIPTRDAPWFNLPHVFFSNIVFTLKHCNIWTLFQLFWEFRDEIYLTKNIFIEVYISTYGIIGWNCGIVGIMSRRNCGSSELWVRPIKRTPHNKHWIITSGY